MKLAAFILALCMGAVAPGVLHAQPEAPLPEELDVSPGRQRARRLITAATTLGFGSGCCIGGGLASTGMCAGVTCGFSLLQVATSGFLLPVAILLAVVLGMVVAGAGLIGLSTLGYIPSALLLNSLGLWDWDTAADVIMFLGEALTVWLSCLGM